MVGHSLRGRRTFERSYSTSPCVVSSSPAPRERHSVAPPQEYRTPDRVIVPPRRPPPPPPPPPATTTRNHRPRGRRGADARRRRPLPSAPRMSISLTLFTPPAPNGAAPPAPGLPPSSSPSAPPPLGSAPPPPSEGAVPSVSRTLEKTGSPWMYLRAGGARSDPPASVGPRISGRAKNQRGRAGSRHHTIFGSSHRRPPPSGRMQRTRTRTHTRTSSLGPSG